MRFIFILLHIIAFSLYFISCNHNDEEYEIKDNDIHISGVSIVNDISRSGIINKTTFDNRDTILFNSYGNHKNTNHRLTYTNNEWRSDRELKWNSKSNDSIHYSAIYPATYNSRYSKNELYSEGRLRDILYSKSSKKYKEKITLRFRHIFSLLNFDYSDIASDNIQSMTITIPAIIDSISLRNGNMHINHNDSSCFTELVGTSNIISCIIPPINNFSVKIRLNYTDKSIERSLEPIDFVAGTIYNCKIIKDNQIKRIKSGEDLVAFLYLINGKKYKSRSLEEFYYLDNGRRIFSLANDISLTEEQNSKLNTYTNTSDFEDLFDGRGHSISNLSLLCSRSSGNALFKSIGENGIVRNLKITDSQIGGTNQIALLSNKNYGLIENVHVTRCTATAPKSNGASIMSFSLFGKIVNCSVTESTINADEIGGSAIFAKSSKGTIINCYSANNTLNNNNNSARVISGMILQTTGPTSIKNCYVKCTGNNTSIYQYCAMTNNNLGIENCFMAKTPNFWLGKVSAGSTYYTYDSNFKVKTSGQDVITLLNEWIDNNQHLYPEYTFKRWKANNASVPAVFIE